MMKRRVRAVLAGSALVLAACGDTAVTPTADTGAQTTLPASETTIPASEDPTTAADTTPAPSDPGALAGIITVGDNVFTLAVEECAFGDELDADLRENGFHFAASGFVAGLPDSVFEVDRVEYPAFGLEDLVFVQIGDPDAPDVYWEASVISQEDAGADPLFLQVDGRTIRGRAWFEDRTSDLGGDLVEGTIEISC